MARATSARRGRQPPRGVTIGWRRYQIAPLTAGDDAGECDADRAIIRLRAGDGAYMAHTLLHEILHACYDQAALRRKDGEERVVSGLANTLAQVLRDNPAVAAFLCKGLNS